MGCQASAPLPLSPRHRSRSKGAPAPAPGAGGGGFPKGVGFNRRVSPSSSNSSNKCTLDPKEVRWARKHLSKLCKRSIKLNRGKLIVQGILHIAGHLNSNGRIYPKNVLEREVRKFVGEKIHVARPSGFGELNHPAVPSSTSAFTPTLEENFRSIDVMRISHQLLEMHWEKDTLFGTIEVLDTPLGLRVRNKYLRGDAIGVSSRGWATLYEKEKDGVVEVEVGEDFSLITFDYVSEPSTPGAYLLPIDFVYEGNLPEQKEITTKATHLHEVQKKMEKQKREKDLQEASGQKQSRSFHFTVCNTCCPCSSHRPQKNKSTESKPVVHLCSPL